MKKYLFLTILALTFSLGRAQTITLTPFSGSYCVGQSFYIYLSYTGGFSGFAFQAEISDAFGNWANNTYISPYSLTPLDSMLVTLPASLPAGTGYRIRVFWGAHSVTSNDNGSNLTINTLPPAPTLSVSGNACAGSDSLTATGADSATQFQWYLNGWSYQTGIDSNYTPNLDGQYTVSYSSSVATGSCISPQSNAVTVNASLTSVFINNFETVCYGMPDLYQANANNGGVNPSYQWYLNNTPVGTNSQSYTNTTATSTDSIRVIMTSSAVCALGVQSSAAIIASVYPVPAPGLLTTSGHGCLGTDSLSLWAGGPFALTWYQGGAAIDSSAHAYVVAGGNGNGSAPNQIYPFGVYADAAGDIYVADAGPVARVLRFPAGSTSMTDGVTVAARGLSSPTSVYVDASGAVYVADQNNNAVWKYPAGSDSTTNGVVVAGQPGSGGSAANQLSQPWGIYVDGSGNLYVADANNARIQKFPAGSDSTINGVTVAAVGLGYPMGVSLDHSGNIYVGDDQNNLVRKFPAGSDSATVGTVVAANGLNDAIEIYVDAAGDIYVPDEGHARIAWFPAGSDSSTVGVTVAGGNGYGSAVADLVAPLSVSLDGNGNIYAPDLFNLRVEKWVPGSPDTTHVPTAAGSYTATYVSLQGCISSVSDTVTISTPPVVSLNWDSLTQAHDLGIFISNVDTLWSWSPNCLPYTPPQSFPLIGGTPLGGTYSGQYVSNDTVNLQTWGYIPFMDTITYTYTNLNGCSATAIDSFVVTFCEGIKTIPGQATISLYPNPNNGSFVLQSSDAVGKEYIITDMLGRIVADETITSNDQNIDLRTISSGSYMLSIKGSDSKEVRFAVE